MIFNNFFKKLFNRVTFTKVIIIFVVGLFSRVFINYFYGVNVFVEYTNLISLYYYGFMSLFVVFIHEVVVYFEWDLFGFLGNFICSVLGFVRTFIGLCFNFFRYLLWGERYFTLGNAPKSFGDNNVTDKSNFTLKRNGENSDKYGKRGWFKPSRNTGWSSAALGGLYGDRPGRVGTSSAATQGLYEEGRRQRSNVGTSEFNTTVFQELKCRLYWYSFKQFGGRFHDYHEFKNSLDYNISIREILRSRFN
jgi:hypothetical protein